MSNSERVTNTEGLLLCNKMAQSLNRNQPEDLLAGVLKPGGKHMVVCMLPYHNEADHHRCMIYADVKGSDAPWTFMLDIQVNLFEQMETVESHLSVG